MKKSAGVMLIVAAGLLVAAGPAGTRTTVARATTSIARTTGARAATPIAPTTVARATTPVTRYSIVNGCYTLGTPSGRVGPFRMQATALGQYLLYAGPNSSSGPA